MMSWLGTHKPSIHYKNNKDGMKTSKDKNTLRQTKKDMKNSIFSYVRKEKRDRNKVSHSTPLIEFYPQNFYLPNSLNR